jgi:ribulose-phosphate 3-epimerase
MIDNPAEQLDWYLDAGADLVTVQLEAAHPGACGERGASASLKELDEVGRERIASMLAQIHDAERKAGLSINPDTSVGLLLPFYRELDLVLLMSVHPGFGGQSFIPESLVRLRQIRTDAAALKADLLLEVDGGIDADTATLAVTAGADVLVAGNAIYGQPDPVAALQSIRRAVAAL